MMIPHPSPFSCMRLFARRPLMFVLSSPSGAGKTTLSRRLLMEDPMVAMSVSMTTRPPRPAEVEGVHYYFTDEAQFQELVQQNALLEWASVHDHHYGTPKSAVAAALDAGRDVLFDIDYQGAQQIAQQQPDLVRLFILPPSMNELARRLRDRAQDSEEVIARRLARARAEMEHWDSYDYVLVNDDFDICFAQIKAILAAERLRRKRQPGLADVVRRLLSVKD